MDKTVAFQQIVLTDIQSPETFLKIFIVVKFLVNFLLHVCRVPVANYDTYVIYLRLYIYIYIDFKVIFTLNLT